VSGRPVSARTARVLREAGRVEEAEWVESQLRRRLAEAVAAAAARPVVEQLAFPLPGEDPGPAASTAERGRRPRGEGGGW
jgi:hypothetical protein